MQRSWFGFVAFFLLILCVSCKQETPFSDHGSMTFEGKSCAVKRVRQCCFVDSLTNQRCVELAFNSPTMSYVDGKISGTGLLVRLVVACDSVRLAEDEYVLLPNSEILQVSDNKQDTIRENIPSGRLEVKITEHGYAFDFADDAQTLKGNYEGAVVSVVDVDGAQVGQLTLNDSVVPLQRAELYRWGPLMAPDLFYYECYFYACNVRNTDAGAVRQGVVLVVGLQAAEADFPANGNYEIVSVNANRTALYGHKSGNVDWGTFWKRYSSASSNFKANVLDGALQLNRVGTQCEVAFDFVDQYGGSIKGNYSDSFVIIDVK